MLSELGIQDGATPYFLPLPHMKLLRFSRSIRVINLQSLNWPFRAFFRIYSNIGFLIDRHYKAFLGLDDSTILFSRAIRIFLH